MHHAIKRLTTGAALTALLLPTAQTYSFAATKTSTPIQHVIIIVGENHTFDNVFGTYKPKAGQKISNLLSKGIVNADGTPGPNFHKADQDIGQDLNVYHAKTPDVGDYSPLPQPYLNGSPDARFPTNLPNGPFQISKYVPYPAITGDPVHRFFQMWQEYNGGKLDKFVWVEKTIGTGSNGNPPPAGGFDPKEGAISMGFYNMNPYTDAKGVAQPGDAPIFKSLADNYAISDNYHQAVMGGTGANFQAIVSGDAAFFTDPNKLDGSAATPFSNQIENPDPMKGTNNYYSQDGYGGGSYVGCWDPHNPGINSVDEVLHSHHVKNNNCAADHYYLVNNYNMFWNQDGSTNALGPTHFVLPPQSNPTIADDLTSHGISWKYYSADRGNDPTTFPTSVDGVTIPFHSYCGICDPLTGYSSIEKTPSEAAKLQNYGAFLNDVKGGSLPAVSFVRPFEALASHPGDSTVNLYEMFIQDLINQVKANPTLWATTAIFITTDEGGGFYDSGYIQPVDFFGDGTRIPLIVVSPYAKQGYVDHTYYDHVSLLKFIEANWGVPPVSKRSRDNLPNPVSRGANAYVPANIPAIGDLMNLFDFVHGPHS